MGSGGDLRKLKCHVFIVVDYSCGRFEHFAINHLFPTVVTVPEYHFCANFSFLLIWSICNFTRYPVNENHKI